MIKIKINPQCAWGRENEVRAYIEAIYNRQDKYGIEIDNTYADIASDVNENGICDTDDIPGCTAAEACNYDPNATLNNGTCDFFTCLVFGCNDPSACNYDVEVDFNDGSCTYASFPYDCNNECVNDVDGDGVCDSDELLGCTDEAACNFQIEP